MRYSHFAAPVAGTLIAAAVVCGCGPKKDSVEGSADLTPAPAKGVIDLAPMDTTPAAPAAAAGPVVTVNGQSLSRAKADMMIQRQMMSQGIPPQAMQQAMAMWGPRVEQQVVQQFVAGILLAEEAKRRKLQASDEVVEQALGKMLKELPEGQTLSAVLAMGGITEEDLRKDIRDNESIGALFEAVTADVPAVTEEEITAFYGENKERFDMPAQVHTRHILIEAREGQADEAAMTAAKTKAETLYKQLVDDKADFAELAKAESSCPSAEEGGDLGFMDLGPNIDPAFAAAATNQALNVIGEVVKSQFGYHIIEALERRPAGLRELAVVHDDIATALKRRKGSEVMEALIEELKAKAKIEYAAAPVVTRPPPGMLGMPPQPAPPAPAE